jgi:hypothetical protein
MIWSDEKELDSTLKRVSDHCNSLKPKDSEQPDDAISGLGTLPPVAVGVERDLVEHKGDPIKTEPYDPMVEKQSSSHHKDSPSHPSEVSTDEDKGEDKDQAEIVVVDDDDDEVEVVGVRGPSFS